MCGGWGNMSVEGDKCPTIGPAVVKTSGQLVPAIRAGQMPESPSFFFLAYADHPKPVDCIRFGRPHSP